jgi:hypothetical protein
MTNEDQKLIYKAILENFKVEELVEPEVYKRHGNNAIYLFCPRLLATLHFIRLGLGKPITVNNWHKGGKFTQRGLRTNISPIVKAKTSLYLSAHIFGQAVDFDVAGLSAEEVRTWLVDNSDFLPYNIRLEGKINGKAINWVHLDTRYQSKKVHIFDV